MNRYGEISDRADPRVKFLLSECRRRRITYVEMERLSGTSSRAQQAWARAERGIRLDTIEAAFNAIGWTLVPMEIAHLTQNERRRVGR